MIRILALSGILLTGIVYAEGSRPFAPLPVHTRLTFRTSTTIYAGYTTQRLRATNGVQCELRLAEALPWDFKVDGTTPWEIAGGSVQRLKWNRESKIVSRYRENAIGYHEPIPDFSGVLEVERLVRFAGVFAGDPYAITSVYRVGGLQMSRGTGSDRLSLLCWSRGYAGGGEFPTLTTLEAVSELLEVQLPQ